MSHVFNFDDYGFDEASRTAYFKYSFSDGRSFEEKAVFEKTENYNTELLERALFLSFMAIGTSYYKTFPSSQIEIKKGFLDDWQVSFFDKVYQEGLSQFAFENNLTREDLAHFKSSSQSSETALSYDGQGVIALQSGGKDSLLTASLLNAHQTPFTPWYIASSAHHPEVLDDLGFELTKTFRQLDKEALAAAAHDGGLNGHIPVTYVVMSLALIEAVLTNKNTVLVSIGHEGEEPHEMIGDLPVNHQWSKTWQAELLFSDYVKKYISLDIKIGSPLRHMSELKVSELFCRYSWEKYAHRFSSCNRANYAQGMNNTHLTWCGDCPKCANSYLLFAPFVAKNELNSLFGGQDLFTKVSLRETFKGLLSIDGVMKPFECVGEIDELRFAYHEAQKNDYSSLPFTVPESFFDKDHEYDVQSWTRQLIS